MNAQVPQARHQELPGAVKDLRSDRGPKGATPPDVCNPITERDDGHVRLGVIAQSVAQRTTEFGIRMALGAAPLRVLGMVLGRETKLIAAALASGAVVTFGIARATFVELANLSAATPSIWFFTVILCASVAFAACLLATRRIVRLDPWVVLSKS